MKYNSIKIKYLGKLTSFALTLILLVILQGCTLNETTPSDTEQLYGETPNVETEWLYLRILSIYDAPQDIYFNVNHTMTACCLRSDVDCHDMEIIFNHLHLPDIGIEVGSHVRVEVARERIIPFPAPLFIRDWELIELTPNLSLVADITNSETTYSLDGDYQSIREHMIADLGYDFYVNHNHAMSQFHAFYDSLPRDQMGEVLYPEYFGGMYIDDKGNLVVLQVESVNATGLNSRFSEDVNIKKVTFSFNQLMETNRVLTYLFSNRSPSMSNVAGSWTDIVNNRLVVYLFEYTEELIEVFKNEVINSPLIAFYQHIHQTFPSTLGLGTD